MYSSLLFALLPAAFAAPLLKVRDASVIPGKYIVKFKGEVSAFAADEAKAEIANTPDFEYSFAGFNGFAGTLTDAEVAKLQANPSVCVWTCPKQASYLRSTGGVHRAGC